MRNGIAAVVVGIGLLHCGGKIASLSDVDGGAAPAATVPPAQPPVQPPAGCAPGATACGGRCVDVASDQNNCGGCGVRCNRSQTCKAGACIVWEIDAGPPACAGAVCQGVCVDTDYDPANCGTCGTTCGEACKFGHCVCSHGNPCNGKCVDHLTDHENCGFCNFPCKASETCVQGHCI